MKLIVLQTVLIFYRPILSINLDLFHDFLLLNDLRHAIVVLCNEQEESDVVKNFNKFINFSIAFFNLNHIAAEKFHAMHFETYKIGIYLNLSCGRTNEILQDASNYSLFSTTEIWLISGKSRQEDQKILEKCNLNINSDVTLAVETQSGTYELYDVFKISHDYKTPLNTTWKGKWVTGKGVTIFPHFKQLGTLRRRDFDGITLKGSLLLTAKPDNVSLEDYIYSTEDKHRDIMHRRNAQLLKMAMELYNFKITPILTDNWGIFLNGTWTGVVGQVHRKEVDLSITPLRFTRQRREVIDYTTEMHIVEIRFIFRHPKNAYVRNVFLRPFHTSVWLAIVALTLLSMFILGWVVKFHEIKDGSSFADVNSPINFAVFTIIGVIFLQGSATVLPATSSKITIFFILIFSTILYQFYSAFIVGSLLTDSPRVITTPDALYKSNLRIGMDDIPYNFEFFSLSTSSRRAKMFYWNKINNPNQRNILPLNEGLRQIKAGGFAFHVEVDVAYRILIKSLTEAEFCELQEIQFLPVFPTAVIVPKGSPWKEHLLQIFRHIQEYGILDYQRKLWSVRKPKCSELDIEKNASVDLEHFLPAILILIFAMVISTVILFVEIIIKQCQNNKR